MSTQTVVSKNALLPEFCFRAIFFVVYLIFVFCFYCLFFWIFYLNLLPQIFEHTATSGCQVGVEVIVFFAIAFSSNYLCPNLIQCGSIRKNLPRICICNLLLDLETLWFGNILWLNLGKNNTTWLSVSYRAKFFKPIWWLWGWKGTSYCNILLSLSVAGFSVCYRFFHPLNLAS